MDLPDGAERQTWVSADKVGRDAPTRLSVGRDPLDNRCIRELDPLALRQPVHARGDNLIARAQSATHVGGAIRDMKDLDRFAQHDEVIPPNQRFRALCRIYRSGLDVSRSRTHNENRPEPPVALLQSR